ncbi:MAG: hypothetical protein KDD34_04780 [Bdellovibrionales bacterium]|nr:hypothetical protein [Bdellovibrionales bacterium]
MSVKNEEREELEWCWVDFIEGEVDSNLKEDLLELMRLSEDSRNTVSSLMWTRELAKSVDPAHDEFLAKWNSEKSKKQIMKQCESIQKTNWSKKWNQVRPQK